MKMEYNTVHLKYSFNLIFSSCRDKELKDIPNDLK